MDILITSLQIATSVALLTFATALALKPKGLQRLLVGLPKSAPAQIGLSSLFAVGAIAMGVSAAIPFVAFFASIFTAAVGAVWCVLAPHRDARVIWPGPVLLVLASAVIAVGQPLGLKVMALPKADALPYEPVPYRVVKTYGPGVWFESVRAAPNGTIFLAANLGLDFSRADYFRSAHGEVVERSPDGRERTVLKTPRGSTAGVFAVAGDGSVYMTSNGSIPGVWRIDANGRSQRLTDLPTGAWPNGLDFGPDGLLYSPDSALGCVWRIDPRTGAATRALEHRALSARPLISLAPGANGLHFLGADMIVTVSDTAEVLKFHLGADGGFGPPTILARGIPGDDFAIGKDGSLFITTHPYNTLVRVSPTGERTIIADARQRIVGATDAAFGRGPGDRDTLYVATDGGAFTGGAKTRGQLVALRPYEHQARASARSSPHHAVAPGRL